MKIREIAEALDNYYSALAEAERAGLPSNKRAALERAQYWGDMDATAE